MVVSILNFPSKFLTCFSISSILTAVLDFFVLTYVLCLFTTFHCHCLNDLNHSFQENFLWTVEHGDPVCQGRFCQILHIHFIHGETLFINYHQIIDKCSLLCLTENCHSSWSILMFHFQGIMQCPSLNTM